MSDARAARIRRILVDRLPDEVLLPTSFRRALTTILLTVLLLAAINFAAKWYLARYPVNRGYWLVQAKWELLGSMSESVDWLIVGDSSANQGVIPSVIAEELGGEAINLATTAGTTLLDDLWMLEEHIERFGPPENVLVTHTVDVWPRNIATVMIAKIPRPWGFWQSSPIYSELDSDMWPKVFLARYLPLYGENGSILHAIIRGFIPSESMFENPYQLGPEGYMPGERQDAADTLKDTENFVGRMEKDGFSISAINQSVLEQMVILADEHDFNLYLFNGPLYEGVLQEERSQEYLFEMHQALEEITGRSNHVHYINLLASFPLDQTLSADHVSHEAALIYSEMLVLEIDDIQSAKDPAD